MNREDLAWAAGIFEGMTIVYGKWVWVHDEETQ